MSETKRHGQACNAQRCLPNLREPDGPADGRPGQACRSLTSFVRLAHSRALAFLGRARRSIPEKHCLRELFPKSLNATEIGNHATAV